MIFRPRLTLAIVLLAAAQMGHPAGARAESGESPDASGGCTRLRSAALKGVKLTAVNEVAPAPQWESPEVNGRTAHVAVRFCRVEGVIAGRVGFELWLPEAARWNGRLLGAGVGGDAGVYNYQDLARGVMAGYSAVTNDSGHKASETHWMMRREAVLDYTHRAQHLMNQTARDLVARFYAKGPHHAYFLGCSGGGRQALKEMQLYPGDYDGVVAGASAPTMPVMSARHLWQALYQQRDPAAAMTDAAWDLVAKAAVLACDANDGVTDGVVENPAQCKFDVATLQCPRGDSGQPLPNCLSSAQVHTVRDFYAPLRDESGNVLDSGLVPGVRTRPGPPSPLLLPLFAQGAHHDLSWGADQFHIAEDLALVNRMMPEMRADRTDLSGFARRNGKALLYQGWMDPSVVAGQSIDYYNRVRAQMGAVTTDAMLRLFMVPGMLHCGGGDGVSHLGGMGDSEPIGTADDDVLTALTAWVEQGKAPDRLQATRIEQQRVTRRRVLCPYPRQAHFLGGDSNDVSRYECAP